MQLSETKNFIANTSPGDTVTMEIGVNDYRRKLTKQQPLGFWDKYSKYKDISLIGVQCDGRTYTTLETYNKQCGGQLYSFTVILGTIGGFLIFFGMLLLI